MSWIDSHLHLSHYNSDADIDKVLTHSIESGGIFFFQGGIDPFDWSRQLEIQTRFPKNIGTSFGLHPWWVDSEESSILDPAFEKLALLAPKALGLGELGLDFGKKTNPEHFEKQAHYFKKQIELALTLKKPLVLHVVNTHGRTLEILKSYSKKYTGIVHSYSGNMEIANQYINLGLTLSIGPGLLDQDGFFALKKMVGKVDLKHIVLETDAPDRLPGPAQIPMIARAISELRESKESPSEILEITTENFRKVFNFGTNTQP